MLERCVERVLQSDKVTTTVIASAQKLPIQEVPVFIGDEQDVLKRYYDCATLFCGRTIVRITSDCPLIDPEVIDDAIKYFYKHNYPYVYFAPVDGLDVEVFTYELLKEAHENATSKEDREHVTPYMKRKTKISVDTENDLIKVREIYKNNG